MDVSGFKFLKCITYERANAAPRELDFENNYLKFLKKKVPVFLNIDGNHYAQLLDWSDEWFTAKLRVEY